MKHRRPTGQPSAAPTLGASDPRVRGGTSIELKEPLYFDGSDRIAVRSDPADSALVVRADYGVENGITKVVCNTSLAPLSVYLPPAKSFEGVELVINSGASSGSPTGNNVTIVTSGSETIDGSSLDVTLFNNYTSVRYLSTGTEWVEV